jgi:hypothetical protein
MHTTTNKQPNHNFEKTFQSSYLLLNFNGEVTKKIFETRGSTFRNNFEEIFCLLFCVCLSYFSLSPLLNLFHMNHPLPEDVWLDLGSIITHSKRERDFRAHFGGPSAAVSYLWSLISSIKTPLFGALELLQTLYFLKSPGFSWATTCSRFDVCESTFKRNLEHGLHYIDFVLPNVSLFTYII